MGDSTVQPINNNTTNSDPFNNKSSDGKSVFGMTNILDALLVRGRITPDEFNKLKFEAVNSGKTVEDVLKAHNIVNSEEIAKLKAEMRGIGFADLSDIVINIDTLNKIT